jgi:hypothetical protein
MTMTRKRLRWIAQFALGAAITATFGRWQYHRGFENGADAAICAFAVGIDGEAKARSSQACQRVGGPRWIVEGFDPGGRQ